MNNSVLEQKILVVFALFCLLGMAGTAWATSANDGFDPGADGTVYSIAIQADGKIVVGGYFTTIGGQARSRIARLHSRWQRGCRFQPGGKRLLFYSIAIQADGKIVVGGHFHSTIGGQSPELHRPPCDADGSGG